MLELHAPEQRLIGPRIVEEVVDIVEVSEVRVDLEDPVWLRQYNRADVKQACPASEERLVLHPCDDVVHTP